MPTATITSSTLSTAIFFDSSVLLIEGVAVFAMSLSRVNGADPHPTQKILPRSDWLQVVGVDAGSNSAEMIKMQAIGDRTVLLLPHPSCSLDRPALDSKLTIPSEVMGALPNPTRRSKTPGFFHIFHRGFGSVMPQNESHGLPLDVSERVIRPLSNGSSAAAAALAKFAHSRSPFTRVWQAEMTLF